MKATGSEGGSRSQTDLSLCPISLEYTLSKFQWK